MATEPPSRYWTFLRIVVPIGKVTVFTTRLEYRPIIHEVRSRIFREVGQLPASTLAVVTSLADPEWLVEIEAVALAG